jgi:hypothetical protein
VREEEAREGASVASLERLALTEELGGLFEQVRLRHRSRTGFRLEWSYLIWASSKKGKWNESGLSCSVVARSTKDASDGFVGHAVISGHLAQGFVVFNDTPYYVRPFFQWDAIVRLTWTRMLRWGDERRKTAKQLFQRKQSLQEFTVRSYKMD